MLTITYFFDSDSAPIDVDNIPKPISDALNGLAYIDDGQLTDILCRKRDRNSSDLRIENSSPVLREAFSRDIHFLHVVVEEAPDQNVIQ